MSTTWYVPFADIPNERTAAARATAFDIAW